MSETQRGLVLRRVAVLEAMYLIQKLCFYAYDNNTTFGTPKLNDSPIMQAAMQDINDKLAGKTLTKVERMRDESLRVTTSDGIFRW